MLTESMLVELIPKMGQRALLINELEKLKISNEVNMPIFIKTIYFNFKLIHK